MAVLIKPEWQVERKSLTEPFSCMMRGGGLSCEWRYSHTEEDQHKKFHKIYYCIHCKFHHWEPV